MSSRAVAPAPADRTDPSDSRLSWAADLLALLLAPLATVALYLPSGLLMPVRIVTVVWAVVVITAAMRRGRTRMAALRSPIVRGTAALIGVFLVFGAIAMVRYRGQTGVNEAVQFGFIALTAVAAAVAGLRRRTLLALVAGWVAAGALAAAVGFWEVVTARHLPGNLPAQQYAGKIKGWNEISSFFDNPNLYAYQIVVILLLLPILWDAVGRRIRWALVPYALAMAYLLLRTEGRMALLAACLGIALWCLRAAWSRWALLAGIVLTGLTALLRLPPGSDIVAFVLQVADNIRWKGTSTWVRAQMAKSGWWMLEQSNFLGVGPGGYGVWAFKPGNPFKYNKLNNAHWGMVEVMAEYGIVSLLALLVALAAVCVLAWRVLRTPISGPDATSLGSAPARPETLDRTIAVAAAIVAVTLPIVCISHSTWLRQPLTAVHIGTLVALAAWTASVGRRGRLDAG